ncbi:hypothetical protein JCM3770_005314 [Rhodotorula araucariae]
MAPFSSRVSTTLISLAQLYDLRGITSTFAKHATLAHNNVVLANGSRISRGLYRLGSELAYPSIKRCRGGRYIVTFTDNFSRMLWVEPLAHKANVLAIFMRFKVAAESESGRRLQRFRSDNGGESVSHAYNDYPHENGIARET